MILKESRQNCISRAGEKIVHSFSCLSKMVPKVSNGIRIEHLLDTLDQNLPDSVFIFVSIYPRPK